MKKPIHNEQRKRGWMEDAEFSAKYRPENVSFGPSFLIEIMANIFSRHFLMHSNDAILLSGTSSSRNAIEMENHVFQKARNQAEYLGFVAKLILHVRQMSRFFN